MKWIDFKLCILLVVFIKSKLKIEQFACTFFSIERKKKTKCEMYNIFKMPKWKWIFPIFNWLHHWVQHCSRLFQVSPFHNCCTSLFVAQRTKNSTVFSCLSSYFLIYTHREINHWNEWRDEKDGAISIIPLKIYKRFLFIYFSPSTSLNSF